MRIAVLGGGVIGVTTAYCLAADGHEVVVLDRQNAVGHRADRACAEGDDQVAWMSEAGDKRREIGKSRHHVKILRVATDNLGQ